MIHWVTLRYANGIVNQWHSYLPPTHGGLWSLGAFDGAECVGVIIVSRPKARRIDDGLTAEVCRVATNGHPNAASALLGRARKVCQAMGFKRLVSYTRASEDGTSYLRSIRAMPMCSRCDEYDKFIKQAEDRGMQELVAFLEHEKAAYVEAAVEANERD